MPRSLALRWSPRVSQIQEGCIYVISRFRVSNAKHSFRPVDSNLMVEFTCRTQVSPAKEEMVGFPLYTYRLTPIDGLKARGGDTRDFVDTIGVLTEVSDSYMVQLPNKPRPTLTRHLILRDMSYSEMKFTLWGERAAAFTMEQVPDQADGKPVLLMVGGLMKRFQDVYYLSANTATRWYFNPAIPEAREFYSSFQDQRVDIKQVAAPVQPQGPVRMPSQLEEKSLLELHSIDTYDFPDDGYRCTVTVARLVPNVSWWFASCTRCSKSCAPEGSGYRCNSCSSTSFRFKYKICLVAGDSTAEAEMICFADVARQIVGKSVQQLLQTGGSNNALHADIAKIVSRRFTFAVSLTQQSYYREEKTYQITSVVACHSQRNPGTPTTSAGGRSSPNGGSSPSILTPGGSANGASCSTTPTSKVILECAGSPPLSDSTPTEKHDDDTQGLATKNKEIAKDSERPTARRRLSYETSDDQLDPVNKACLDSVDVTDELTEAGYNTEKTVPVSKSGEKESLPKTRARRAQPA